MSRGTYITPFEQRLANIAAQILRRTGRPATTTAICAAMAFTVPESTTRYWLRQAERKGIIYRRTERSGWLQRPQGVEVEAWHPMRMFDRWKPHMKQTELMLPCEVNRETAQPKVTQSRRRGTADEAGPVQLELQLAVG